MIERARAECPACRKILTVMPPKGGDGSALVFPLHPPGGPYCRRSRRICERESLMEEQGRRAPKRNATHSLYGSGHVNATRTRECVAMPGLREQTIFTPPPILEVIYHTWPGGIELDPCWHPDSLVKARERIVWPERDGLAIEWPPYTFFNPPFGELEKWLRHAMELGSWELFTLAPSRTHRKWYREFVRETGGVVAELNPVKFWSYETVKDEDGKVIEILFEKGPREEKQAFPFPVDLHYAGDHVDRLVEALERTGIGELRAAA